MPRSRSRTRLSRWSPRAIVVILGRLCFAALLCGVVWAAYDAASALRATLNGVADMVAPLPTTTPCPSRQAAAQDAGPCDDGTRLAVAPNPDGQLLHPPSVSAHAIWLALSAAGSPLADDGPRRDGKTYTDYLWDAGRANNIDPAIVMGIFHVESQYGTAGIARLTNSVGNIRPLAGEPSLNGYRTYPDWFAGIDATVALLRSYADSGVRTIDQAIPIWAPPADHNDPAAYVAAVHDTMNALAALGN